MNKTKVVFLDVDGVLNCWSTTERIDRPDGTKGLRGVDAVLCDRLRRIIAATNAQIVLSSTWRRLPESLHYLWRKLHPLKERWYGTTPTKGANRGEEIMHWLATHPEVTRYVVLDDDGSACIHAPYHVLTDEMEGLTESQAQEAIQLLNS